MCALWAQALMLLAYFSLVYSEHRIININEHRTYGTNQIHLICNCADITSLIMEYLSAGNCLHLGLCNQDNFKLFQAQASLLKHLIKTTDHLMEMLSPKMDVIDRYLIKRRLQRVTFFLSLWNGTNTTLNSLFPSYALNKMKTDSNFRICRGFDANTNKNCFCLRASGHAVDGEWHSECYFLFVFDTNASANLFYAWSTNDTLLRGNHLIVNIQGALAEFLLDYQVGSFSIRQPDKLETKSYRTNIPMSLWIHSVTLLMVAMSPSILYFSPIPDMPRHIIYVTVYIGSFFVAFFKAPDPYNGRDIFPLAYCTLYISTLVWFLIDMNS